MVQTVLMRDIIVGTHERTCCGDTKRGRPCVHNQFKRLINVALVPVLACCEVNMNCQ